MPRFYKAKDAPGTPEQGDLRYNESNNTLETYSGSAWGTITFGAVTAGDVTAGAVTGTSVTSDTIRTAIGFPSLNTTTPGFYVPAGAGAITGIIPSLALRAPIAFNTVGRQIMVRYGGSWFTSASLNLA